MIYKLILITVFSLIQNYFSLKECSEGILPAYNKPIPVFNQVSLPGRSAENTWKTISGKAHYLPDPCD
jgi:hypothetical protein